MPDASWPDAPVPDAAALAAEARAFAAVWSGDRQRLVAATGIRALTDPGTVAVVTGQQPAVGGGPLYTLIKAAHACALAQRLRDAGVPAVPVFWCASEDHDLGEAGHADLLRADGSIRRVVADLGGGRASLRHRPALRWWPAMVEACRDTLRGALGAAWLDAHRPEGDEDMGAWQCRLLRDAFTRQGLECVEAHRLRPLWRSTVTMALQAWPAQELAVCRERLLAAGHADAFGPLTDVPLFDDGPAGRQALMLAEAMTVLERMPERVSPGAALRPVLQQVALPACMAVVGPGELAYHRFIAPLYGALGVVRPRLVPRCSLTLVPGWVERGVRNGGVEIEAVLADAVAAPPNSVHESSTSLAGLDAALATLASSATDAESQRRTEAGLRRLRRERDRLAASLERGRRRAAGQPPWGALTTWLRPRGQAQERTMSLFQAFWEHGPGVADALTVAARELPAGGSGVVRV